jgi:hypothetical protein
MELLGEIVRCRSCSRLRLPGTVCDCVGKESEGVAYHT